MGNPNNTSAATKTKTESTFTPMAGRRGMPYEGTHHWGTKAQISIGWRIADGTNGTPNATDRFVRAATKDSDVGTQYSATTALPLKDFKVGVQTQKGQTVKINPPDVTTEGADIRGNIFGLNSPPAGPTKSWQFMQSRLSDGSNIGLSDIEGKHTHNRVSKQLDTVYIKPEVKHFHKIKQEEFDSGVLPDHTHPLSGGDDETAPKHILAYYIVWCGIEVDESGKEKTKQGWLSQP